MILTRENLDTILYTVLSNVLGLDEAAAGELRTAELPDLSARQAAELAMSLETAIEHEACAGLVLLSDDELAECHSWDTMLDYLESTLGDD